MIDEDRPGSRRRQRREAIRSPSVRRSVVARYLEANDAGAHWSAPGPRPFHSNAPSPRPSPMSPPTTSDDNFFYLIWLIVLINDDN